MVHIHFLLHGINSWGGFLIPGARAASGSYMEKNSFHVILQKRRERRISFELNTIWMAQGDIINSYFFFEGPQKISLPPLSWKEMRTTLCIGNKDLNALRWSSCLFLLPHGSSSLGWFGRAVTLLYVDKQVKA